MFEKFYPESNSQKVGAKIFSPMNVNFNLKNYINKDGKSQILLVVTSEGKRKRVPLDIYIKPTDWDKNKQRAKKSEDSETINLLLDQIFSKISDIRIHYRLSKIPLSLDKLIEEFKNKTPDYDFIAFMKHHLGKMILRPNSFKKHISEIKKLEEYRAYIPFHEINMSFIDSYKGYLANTKNNAPTTIASSIKIITKFLRIARKYGIFLNLNVDDIKPGSTKGNRVNLNIEEVNRLKAYYFSQFIKPNHKLTLGYFLFSCYSSLRISDIQKLNRQDVESDTLTYVSTKTNNIHTVIITKTAKEIVEHNPELFVTKISDQKMNKALKEIANICSIKKKVHFHVARHSFATNFLRKGGKIEDLQVIMDHSDIQTTMVYVHIIKSESIKSMYLMDD
ncbi:site-specific integrase [Riemerella columbipharyngis]|uniref:Site-specific recombinase XerD n=1 Tax=Riemerella columbipharyngis TaxID=1071918 RepID=A0A1G7E052_9FLAO|nr:site-specific integrase [Riemerella columbipharyngis]SDE57044.1 Site-specific recombinase XerD [Riemerella columbipharyngis]